MANSKRGRGALGNRPADRGRFFPARKKYLLYTRTKIRNLDRIGTDKESIRASCAPENHRQIDESIDNVRS